MASRRDFLKQAIAGVAAAAAAGAVPSAFAGASAAPSRRARGLVQTVQGPLEASKLGFTLPHEHLYASSAGFWQAWPEYFGGRTKFMGKVVDQLKRVKDQGVDTIIEVTPVDLGRDIRFMQEVSRKSGMQIVACTGHWLYPSLSMGARTVAELADFFGMEIERGIEGTDIKAGVIKVATEREGVTPFLGTALKAAARASKATGTPVTTHSLAVARGGEEQAKVFEAEGLDAAKVCIGHSDETDNMDYLAGLARRGYTLGMDHFMYGLQAQAAAGGESPAAKPAAAGPVPWRKRAECVKKLVDAGFADKLFLSNDWFFGVSIAGTGTMEAVEKINPDGMLLLTRKVIPYLRQIGVPDQAIRAMTIDNPKRFFA
jgi:phosphotriesterase-related protein